MDIKLKTILEKCKKDDRESQKELFFKYYHQVYSTVRKYMPTKELAEECTNDIFLKLFKILNKYNFKSPFELWLRRVAINYAIDQLRKKRPIKFHVTKQTNGNLGADNLGFEDLMNVVNQLSFQYKTVFLLNAVDGFSHNEISDMLNISVGTSKSNLSKAKKRLREMIIKNERISSE